MNDSDSLHINLEFKSSQICLDKLSIQLDPGGVLNESKASILNAKEENENELLTESSKKRVSFSNKSRILYFNHHHATNTLHNKVPIVISDDENFSSETCDVSNISSKLKNNDTNTKSDQLSTNDKISEIVENLPLIPAIKSENSTHGDETCQTSVIKQSADNQFTETVLHNDKKVNEGILNSCNFMLNGNEYPLLELRVLIPRLSDDLFEMHKSYLNTKVSSNVNNSEVFSAAPVSLKNTKSKQSKLKNKVISRKSFREKRNHKADNLEIVDNSANNVQHLATEKLVSSMEFNSLKQLEKNETDFRQRRNTENRFLSCENVTILFDKIPCVHLEKLDLSVPDVEKKSDIFNPVLLKEDVQHTKVHFEEPSLSGNDMNIEKITSEISNHVSSEKEVSSEVVNNDTSTFNPEHNKNVEQIKIPCVHLEKLDLPIHKTPIISAPKQKNLTILSSHMRSQNSETMDYLNNIPLSDISTVSNKSDDAHVLATPESLSCLTNASQNNSACTTAGVHNSIFPHLTNSNKSLNAMNSKKSNKKVLHKKPCLKNNYTNKKTSVVNSIKGSQCSHSKENSSSEEMSSEDDIPLLRFANNAIKKSNLTGKSKNSQNKCHQRKNKCQSLAAKLKHFPSTSSCNLNKQLPSNLSKAVDFTDNAQNLLQTLHETSSDSHVDIDSVALKKVELDHSYNLQSISKKSTSKTPIKKNINVCPHKNKRKMNMNTILLKNCLQNRQLIKVNGNMNSIKKSKGKGISSFVKSTFSKKKKISKRTIRKQQARVYKKLIKYLDQLIKKSKGKSHKKSDKNKKKIEQKCEENDKHSTHVKSEPESDCIIIHEKVPTQKENGFSSENVMFSQSSMAHTSGFSQNKIRSNSKIKRKSLDKYRLGFLSKKNMLRFQNKCLASERLLLSKYKLQKKKKKDLKKLFKIFKKTMSVKC